MDGQRRVGPLRKRLSGRSENTKRQRQAAHARIDGAGGDDPKSLFRRKIAQSHHPSDPARLDERRFGMRHHHCVNIGEITSDALRDVARGRKHAIGAAQQLTQCAAPRGDVHSPLPGPLRQARGAAERVRLAAITPIRRIEVILRADRIIVVQRAVVRHAHSTGQVQHRARQAVHMMKMHAHQPEPAQQRYQRRQLGGQSEIGGKTLPFLRP